MKTIFSVGETPIEYSNEQLVGLLALALLIAGAIVAFRVNRPASIGFVRDFGVLRFFHYIAMFG